MGGNPTSPTNPTPSTKQYKFTLDKTFQQIYDAFVDGRPVLLKMDDPQGILESGASNTSIGIVKAVYWNGDLYSIVSDMYSYDAESPNDYPSTIEEIPG